jgi:putative DNA primase/helicase
MLNMEPDDLRKAAMFVSKIRTTAGINAILFFAASDPRITTTQEDYDANRHLLNTPDGTYELDTGIMREHRREDLITKITRYAPDFKRKPAMFDSFMDKITLERNDLRDALQVYAGSGCSGKYPKDKLALCQGDGSNCKTVFLEAIADTLGDYAARLNIRHLTQDDKESPSGHTDEIASIANSRFVISVESQQDRRLNEANVKKYTGGDGIPVSFKHGHTFIMHPAFSLFILTNHKPKVTGRDTGIWRRLAFFPFDYKIPEEDKDLDFKVKLLEADGPCIMAWLIEGCRKWYADGYGNFQTVADATSKYRADEDVLGRFLEERCTTGNGFSVQAKALRTAFEQWCNENGERLFSGRAWRQALEERGFSRTHGMYGKKWSGLMVNEDEVEKNVDDIPF